MYKITINKEFTYPGDIQEFLRNVAMDLNTGIRSGDGWEVDHTEGVTDHTAKIVADSNKNKPQKEQTGGDDKVPGNDKNDQDGVFLGSENAQVVPSEGKEVKVEDKKEGGIWPWSKKE